MKSGSTVRNVLIDIEKRTGAEDGWGQEIDEDSAWAKDRDLFVKFYAKRGNEVFETFDSQRVTRANYVAEADFYEAQGITTEMRVKKTDEHAGGPVVRYFDIVAVLPNEGDRGNTMLALVEKISGF